MKILMIHPIYSSIGEWERSLVRNFEHLGDEIKSIDYRKVFKWHKLNSLLKKLNAYEYFLEKEILSNIKSFNPDMIFVSKGELVAPSILKKMREFNIPMINWIGDGMWEFELIKSIAPYYDTFYTFDSETIKQLEKLNINNAKYLPFGFDTLLDRNFETDDLEYYKSDIAFVGTPTPERMTLLSYLEKTKYDIKIWGPKTWEDTPYKKYYMGRPIYGKEMYFAYSQAKIVINIHYGFENNDVPYYSGINHRVFESFGIGTYCLSNYQDDMNKHDFFSDLITYRDFEELPGKIEYIFNSKIDTDIKRERITNDNSLIKLIKQIRGLE
jgi:spore maturation protein CgeB